MSNKQKFKQITKDSSYLNFVNQEVSRGFNITEAVKNLCKAFGLEYSDNLRRRFSERLAKKGITEKTSDKYVPLELSNEYQTAVKRTVPKSKYYLVTWAQAETEIHKQFWENMKAYADHIGAEIIVSAGRYKNPNSIEKSREIESKEKNKSVWDKEIRDYLYASRLELNDMLSVLCDVKIQPTNVYPINGIEGFTSMKTSIVPHPKVQLKSLPVLKDYPHKLVLSTGACTVENYTDTRIGKVAEFQHELGFVICEIVDDNKFYVRQVQADDTGRFFDLNYEVVDGEVYDEFVTQMMSGEYEDGGEYPFIVWGDLHLTQEDTTAVELAKELTRKLKVKDVILHDLFDGVSVNPHSEKDPFRMLEKEEYEEDNLKKELDYLFDWLDNTTEELTCSKLNIVASNHNDFLDRFLKNTDWRKSRNKKLYLSLANIKAQGLDTKGIVNYLIDDRYRDTSFKNRINTLGYGDSLRIKGWELGLHYDKGANGSRGNIHQFKNLSTKTVGGHGHSAQRYAGAVMTPTLTKLQLDYNSDSLSSWVQGVTLCYPTGKVSQIIFIDGGFTTLWS